MSAVIFHSQPMSAYLWTASLVAAEKGVPWSVNVIEPGSAEHRKLHPFAKSPVLQHGAIFIHETPARITSMRPSRGRHSSPRARCTARRCFAG